MRPSKGHFFYSGALEFFTGADGQTYRAPLFAPLGDDGYRLSARHECGPRTPEQLRRQLMRDGFDTPTDTPERRYAAMRTEGDRT